MLHLVNKYDFFIHNVVAYINKIIKMMRCGVYKLKNSIKKSFEIRRIRGILTREHHPALLFFKIITSSLSWKQRCYMNSN